MRKRRPIAAAVLSTRNKDRSTRGAAIRQKIEGAAGAASSFPPGRSSETLGNWLSVATGMRRGGRL
jgi:hypothetical protein